jgi:hypothetical protein
MQDLGYTVPAAKAKQPPILNFKCDSVMLRRGKWVGVKPELLQQVEMTKAEYSEIWADYKGVYLSACEQFKMKVCPCPKDSGPSWRSTYVAVFITDSKTHATPDSDSINPALEAA